MERFPACRFNAMRLRAEALEPELNAAILEIGKETSFSAIWICSHFFPSP